MVNEQLEIGATYTVKEAMGNKNHGELICLGRDDETGFYKFTSNNHSGKFLQANLEGLVESDLTHTMQRDPTKVEEVFVSKGHWVELYLTRDIFALEDEVLYARNEYENKCAGITN